MTELLVLNAGKHELQAVSLDGTRVRTLVAGLDELPDGIVVDQRRGHVYWTNMGAPDPGSDSTGDEAYTRNGSLERADLDGGNRVTIVPRGAFTGRQTAAPPISTRACCTGATGRACKFCVAISTAAGCAHLVVTGVGDEEAHVERNHCVGIAVDVDRRLLYWTQKGAPNAGEGRIFRAPLDLPAGTSPQYRDDIELLWKDLPEPIDLHLLDGGATLLWTDRGDARGEHAEPRDRAADVGYIRDRLTGYREAIGVAAVSESEFYVSDLGGSIRHVDLNAGVDTELVHLGYGLTGITVAEL